MISKRGDFFVLGMSENTKGVHLSPLGFAACQSKKSTNREKCTNVMSVDLLRCWCTSCSGKRQSRAETSAPPE